MTTAGTAIRPSASRKIHHAWWVALASGLVLFVQGGLGSYMLGVLQTPWVNEFDWPRTSIALAYSAGTLLPGLSGVMVGRWTDQYGPRWIILAGAAITGLSYVLLAGVNNLFWFFIVFLIGALGRCGTSNVPVQAAIARWFSARRSFAMGLASTGISLAGVIMVPVATWLVLNLGWRTTVVIAGASIWIMVLPVVWLVMSGTPAERGLQPYGVGRVEKRRRTVSSVTLGGALRGSTFWIVATSLTLGQVGSNSIGIHAQPALLDKGVGATEAAAAISVMAACGLFGKPVFGWLGDRFPSPLLMAGSYLLMSTGFALLALSNPGAGVWLFAIVQGASLGGTVALQSVVVADLFGIGSYGAILGAISLPGALMATASPLIAGSVRDVTGSFAPAFLLFASIGLLGSAGLVVAYLRTWKLRAFDGPGETKPDSER